MPCGLGDHELLKNARLNAVDLIDQLGGQPIDQLERVVPSHARQVPDQYGSLLGSERRGLLRVLSASDEQQEHSDEKDEREDSLSAHWVCRSVFLSIIEVRRSLLSAPWSGNPPMLTTPRLVS